MKIIEISQQPHKFIKRNNLGFNTYLYRWYVYIEDNRKDNYGTQIYYKDKWINVKVSFIGKKPEVKKWLKDNNLKYDW